MNTSPSLIDSWLLDLKISGAADGTLRAYRAALTPLLDFLGGRSPTTASRADLRRYLADQTDRYAPATVRQRLKVLRAFYRWLAAEDELTAPDPTAGLKGPAEPRTSTVTLSQEQCKALLGTCAGNGFKDRRDLAVLMLLLDAGLRRAECAGLLVDDIDLRAGTVHVVGKGSRLRGPKHRVVPIGLSTCQAVDRYLRVRARHPLAARPELWLSRGTSPMSVGWVLTGAGVRALVESRGRQVGLELHAHVLRHTWANAYRLGGGNEGELMILGGWSNRAMLDRYGATAASERAIAVGRTLSLGDRLRKR